ncbi:ABC transporter ATP-binding protein [Nocardioides houyundeii]|uniref:ABC transporter ATP-binding protein n=1 Tax=Nocardioides houyundeii TaxID=2045452 RepID=UPI000C785490|nr:ABC transporter ATP-binding protein [Nocardioides houyundeii]
MPDLPRTRPLLALERIDVHYGRGRTSTHVIHDVSLQVARGEIVGLIGESGSGKSTIARAVLGLVGLSGGDIHVDGEHVNVHSRAQRRAFRRRGVVQYVFQDPLRSLDGDVSIGDSIAEPLRIRGGLSRAAVKEKVREYAGKARLDVQLLDCYPAEISGGQRQRAAIARALITEPKLLILDEPVSALDAATRVRIIDGLTALRDEGIGMLYISHDLGSVAGVTDRTVVLSQGVVVESGRTQDVVTDPQHLYTRLLVGSAPLLSGEALTRHERNELRRQLSQAFLDSDEARDQGPSLRT